jgi:hypothetical protein
MPDIEGLSDGRSGSQESEVVGPKRRRGYRRWPLPVDLEWARQDLERRIGWMRDRAHHPTLGEERVGECLHHVVDGRDGQQAREQAQPLFCAPVAKLGVK